MQEIILSPLIQTVLLVFFLALFFFSCSVASRQYDRSLKISAWAGIVIGIAVAFFAVLNTTSDPSNPFVFPIWLNTIVGLIGLVTGCILPRIIDNVKSNATMIGTVNAILSGVSIIAIYYTFFTPTTRVFIGSFTLGMVIGTAGYIMTHSSSGQLRLLIAVFPPTLEVSPSSFSFSQNCFPYPLNAPPTSWKCYARLRNHFYASDDVDWTASSAKMLGITVSPPLGKLAPGDDIQVEITVPDTTKNLVVQPPFGGPNPMPYGAPPVGRDVSILFKGPMNSVEIHFSA